MYICLLGRDIVFAFKLRTRLENAESLFINSIIKLLIVLYLKCPSLHEYSANHIEDILLSYRSSLPFHVKASPVVLLPGIEVNNMLQSDNERKH